MTAYEIYGRGAMEGIHLIGILPERRGDPARITNESIMNWGRIILGNIEDFGDLFFIQVRIDHTGEISYPHGSFRREEKG
jgi:hypothetical protein